MKDEARRERRGNTMVEMAFVMVPLFAIIIGVVDFGFAIFLRSTFQHAVREGARFAVTYGILNGQCQDASIKSVVQSQAMGFLAGSTGLDKVHVRYYNPTDFTEITGANGNAPGNIVEVSIENYRYDWLAPIWWKSDPLFIQVRSSDRMEGLGAGQSPPCR